MDAKIKKYARSLEIVSWILMIWGMVQWVMRWFADWLVYGFGCLPGSDSGLSQYSSLADALGKLTSEQMHNLTIADVTLRADFGGSWMGLFSLAKLSWPSRLLGFACDGIAVVIMTIGFWFFIKLMQQFKVGSAFSIDVIELFHKLSRVIFWFALYVPVNRMLVTLITSLQNPPGDRFFMISITLTDCLIFVASYFFMILMSLIRESHQLQEDKDLTV